MCVSSGPPVEPVELCGLSKAVPVNLLVTNATVGGGGLPPFGHYFFNGSVSLA